MSEMTTTTTMMMTITVSFLYSSLALCCKNTHSCSVDVDELRRDCGFQITTYNPTSSYTQLLLVAATGNSVFQPTATVGTIASTTSVPAFTSTLLTTASNPAAATTTEITSLVAGETGNGAAMATGLPKIESLGAVAGVAALVVAAWV
jgi:hypothetical protein